MAACWSVPEITGFDDPENPMFIDNIMKLAQRRWTSPKQNVALLEVFPIGMSVRND